VISDVKERKLIEFYDESDSGKGLWKVEPYLIAIEKNGKGNIFFTGYVYTSDELKLKNNSGSEGQFLLKKIDVTRFKILDEEFDSVKLDNDVIFDERSTVRVVYRVVIPKIKKPANAIKKLPPKKSTAAAKSAKRNSARKLR